MKQLTVDDYKIVKPYLDKANYEGYNSNFITMMMWNHEYHIEYEIHDHFMIMLHHYKGTKFFAMPFTTKDYYKEAIDYMISYSQEHHFDFMMDGAIESFVEDIKEIYGSSFIYARCPNNDDYIYDLKMLKTLSGKKMQKRRNHYNAFKKDYPDAFYRELDAKKDFDEIITCISRWENNHGELSESVASEVFGLLYLLSNSESLDFKTGGLFINGKMEAFIIASLLPHKTIQIHVEKANKNIRGLYPAILKEFLEREYDDQLYINREDDLGIENLRKAKLALHPIKMVHKFQIYLNQTRIEKARDEDQQQIEDLWNQCFEDEDEETSRFYFDHYYHKDETYVLRNGNIVISVLQIPKLRIMLDNRAKETRFILGVCTRPEYQKQGFMKQLMNEVLSKHQNEIIYLQAYQPDLYRPFGFNASHYHQVIEINKEILEQNNQDTSLDTGLLKEYYNSYVSNFNEYKVRNDKDFDLIIQRSKVFKDEIVIYEGLGYMIYHENDDTIYIQEFIYLNQDSIKPLLNHFYDTNKRLILECDLKVKIDDHNKLIITMMSNTNQEDILDPSKYINEIY